MKQLPRPEIYEEELRTTPWGKMIEAVVLEVHERAPVSGALVDLMCGPGVLLHKIAADRYDLTLYGVDNDPRFIRYAERLPSTSHKLLFRQEDAFEWNTVQRFDIVTCTAGVHHLPYDKQEPFIKKVADILKPDGVAIIGDPYISDYQNELERRLGAAELGDAFTTSAIRMGASDEVIKAAIDVMYNDIFGHEYKTSVRKNREMFGRHLTILDERFTWLLEPDKEYGDCYFVLGKK